MWLELREPGTGKLLAKYNPGTRELQVQRRRRLTGFLLDTVEDEADAAGRVTGQEVRAPLEDPGRGAGRDGPR